MIGIDGVADFHVQRPIGPDEEIARRLLDPDRSRRRRHLRSQNETLEDYSEEEPKNQETTSFEILSSINN